MTRIIPLADEDRQTYTIIGAAMEVHKVLGRSFLEPVYHAALALELGQRRVPFTREVEMPVYYKNELLSVKYRADYICFGDVLLELKVLPKLSSREESQLINYLAASRLTRGILINFGGRSLQFKRFLGRGASRSSE
ncbi:MAG: GxxExxY protein [Gemmatimonadales bacterium]